MRIIASSVSHSRARRTNRRSVVNSMILGSTRPLSMTIRNPICSRTIHLAGALLACAMSAAAGDFAMPGGPMPADVDEIEAQLARDGYDMELLISFGTSKGGSAGHMALALRDAGAADDIVYSANFYADRDPKHANDFYTDDLMTRVPKKEYLFGTSSSLGPK